MAEAGKVTITYYGHACFMIEYSNQSIMIDPYEKGSVPGIDLPAGLKVNKVLCSHNHHDHNAAHLIKSSNDLTAMSIESFTVPHDDKQGTLRGMCDINIIHCGDVTVVHCGDIGNYLSSEQLELVKHANILLIPVGGYYTIDAKVANELIHQIEPQCTIVMHYYNHGVGYEVLASLDDVKKDIGELKVLRQSSISGDKQSVPAGIYALKPVRK